MAERATQRTIRNKRNVNVSVRLKNYKQSSDEKRFNVSLQPRGRRGDWTTVPGPYTLDPSLEDLIVSGIVEIIPLTEARKISYTVTRRPDVLGVEEITFAPTEFIGDQVPGTAHTIPEEYR